MQKLIAFTVFSLHTFSCPSYGMEKEPPFDSYRVSVCSPTFYQLQQIATIATVENSQDLYCKEMYKFKKGFDPKFSSPIKDLVERTFTKNLDETISQFHLSTLPEDKKNWSLAVDYLIQSMPQDISLTKPLNHPEVIDVIKKVIETELEASLNYSTFFWRYSKKSPEAEKAGGHRHSFSHGLFSGYLFDDHMKFNNPEYFNKTACTYIFLADAISMRQLKEVGIEGIREKFVQKFPEGELRELGTDMQKTGNETHDLSTLSQAINIIRGTNDAALEQPFLSNLSKKLSLLKFIDNNIHNTSGCLYGWKLPCHYAEILLYQSQWVKASANIYGAGEEFHPKLQLDKNGETILIYSNLEDSPF